MTNSPSGLLTRRTFVLVSCSGLVTLTAMNSKCATPNSVVVVRKTHRSLRLEEDQMRTPIRLAANSRFIVQLHARTTDCHTLGWVYLAGFSGNAQLQVVDGGESAIGQQKIESPGVVASSILSGKDRVIRLEIQAGGKGFQGEACFELIG